MVKWLKRLVVIFFLLMAFLFAFFTVSAARDNVSTPLNGETGGHSINPDGGFRTPGEIARDLSKYRVRLLKPSWELRIAGQAYMAEKDGALYVSSLPGMIYCLDASTGAVRWSYDLGAMVSSRPAVSGGTVYVGSADHVLYALDAQTGALLWYFRAQGEVLASPVISDGVLFFFADNDSVLDLMNRLYALDARTGKQLWTYDTKSWTPSPPAVGHGAVFTGGSFPVVTALETTTGRVIWSREVDSLVYSSPCLREDEVIITTVNGGLYSLDAATGEIRWKSSISEFTPSSPVVAGDSLYVSTYGRKLTALSLADGDTLWSKPLPGSLADMAAGPAEYLYTYKAKGYLLQIDTSTGELVGILITPHPISSAPYITDGRCFIISPDDHLRAYSSADLPGG